MVAVDIKRNYHGWFNGWLIVVVVFVVAVVVIIILIEIRILILIIIICWQAGWLAVIGEVVGSAMDCKLMPLKSLKDVISQLIIFLLLKIISTLFLTHT